MKTSEAQRKRYKKYWDKNKEKLNAKRREKILGEQYKILSHLIYDYIAGVQLGELNEKYKVTIRKQRNDTSISVPER